MRRAARVDANHAAIVSAFRAYGCSVVSLAAVGNGVPDLIVGRFGVTHLVEVKDGSKAKSARKLTAAQVKFRDSWKGACVHIVESVTDVVRLAVEWAEVYEASLEATHE